MIIVLLLMSGCSDENNPASPNDNNRNNGYGYFIESDPSISSDRSYTYFIATDTTNLDNPESGIYKAQVINPVREKVLKGENFSNPAVSPDNLKIAFLEFDTIKIYDINNDTVGAINSAVGYSSFAFIRDTVLLGGKQGNIYLINLNSQSEISLDAGYDIMPYRRDTLVMIQNIGLTSYTVNKISLSESSPDKTASLILNITPIDTVISGIDIRWASVEPMSNRYAYSAGSSIYASSPLLLNPYQLATDNPSRALFLDYNLIIYTGEGGRFHHSDFEGSYSYPFWGFLFDAIKKPDRISGF